MALYSTGFRIRLKSVVAAAAPLLAVWLFFSPVVYWGASIRPAWWWPFLAWALVIGLAALARESAADSGAAPAIPRDT